MVFKWLFVSDQTALQSETLTTTSMVQNHMANGDIYKIVSPQLDTQTVLFHLYIQQI